VKAFAKSRAKTTAKRLSTSYTNLSLLDCILQPEISEIEAQLNIKGWQFSKQIFLKITIFFGDCSA
jgi:hypothetical protein